MQVVAFVGTLLLAAVAFVAAVVWYCVGPTRLRTIRERPEWFRTRVRSVAPYIALLAGVLVVNKGLQGVIERFSHTYGIEATGLLYAIEGNLVVTLQGFVPQPLMGYFAAAYVLGYVAVLVTPVIAYTVAERTRPLTLLVTAYAVNYGVAVVCYAAIVAYGPRNAHRGGGDSSADAALLELVPDITTVTALVNTNTNVFPSLHTSLSVTVLVLAWLTRTEFPRWFGVASVLAVSIVLSTMALGIHWVSDVLAGIVLAVVAVAVAEWVVDER